MTDCTSSNLFLTLAPMAANAESGLLGSGRSTSTGPRRVLIEDASESSDRSAS
jgi:hypothetical protein